MDEVSVVHSFSLLHSLPEERKCWMVKAKAASTHPVQYSSAYFEKQLEMRDLAENFILVYRTMLQ